MRNDCRAGTACRSLYAMDENYLFVMLGSNSLFGLLDRKSGEMSYIKLINEQAETQNGAQDADPQTGEANIFGGQGNIRIMHPYTHCGPFLRDDRRYYYGLYCVGTFSASADDTDSSISRTEGDYSVLTDGERLYTVHGAKVYTLDED
ncbi:MAG: hypothetical protein IKI58_10745 [Oscillospiraceae bacterium]|nr:hypothetical protein [Oscillospiraceae bacterium]